MILATNGLILLIPGVNFFLIVRYALLYGKRQGILCALGISSAILLHVSFALLCINTIVDLYPNAFLCVKVGGFLYLLFLSLQSLKKAFSKEIFQSKVSEKIDITESVFLSGFFVDLFNPFISIFYLGLFASLNLKTSTSYELSGYIFLISLITITWFVAVAIFFSSGTLREKLIKRNRLVQGISGIAILYFAMRLILTPI